MKCMDSRFICGSVAKVERLWFLADNLLQTHRKATTHMMGEANFSKVNKTCLGKGMSLFSENCEVSVIHSKLCYLKK